MMSQRQSIQSIIDSETTAVKDKQLFRGILRIGKFARDDLLLPDNKSYTSYVELGRDYATWVIFAAEPFSLQPKKWCFWIVGCVPYRGYFDYSKAQQFSKKLKRQGYDVYIAPVTAYSTLGWFRDPVLSSMLSRGELATAEYIFHELAHQQLYIKNDTRFNEAYATAVGQIGISKWLMQENKPEALDAYLQSNQHKQQIYKIITEFRELLSIIYQSSLNKQEKLEEKSAVFAEYRKIMVAKLHAWGKDHQYKSWLLDGINNAKFNAFATYHALVPLFIDLYQRCNKRLEKFYAAIERMSQLNAGQRLSQLKHSQCLM